MALGESQYRVAYIDDVAALQDVSVLAERAYMHLAFGQRSTACCLVRIKPDALRVELREHSRAKITAALDELEAAGWLSIDRQSWTIALPKQSQRTPSANPNVARGKLREAQKFPPCAQRDDVVAIIEQELELFAKQLADRLANGSETVTQTSNSISNSNPTVAKATDSAAVADRPKRAMARPTLDEAVAYFQEQGSTTAEATAFFDRNTAGGWLVGRNPMKDWRAAARNWLHNEAKWSKQGSYRGKPQAPGKLSGQNDVFSPEEMAKIRANPDTTPW